MALDTADLIYSFLFFFLLAMGALRFVGGKYIPVMLNAMLCIPIASLFSISNALSANQWLRMLIASCCLYFVLTSILVRRFGLKAQTREFQNDRFSASFLYLSNILLSCLFLPIFINNITDSINLHKQRISAIQGFGFLFYPHYFLSIGIVSLYVLKIVKGEKRSYLNLIAFVVSAVSLITFGGRVFPLLVLVGLSIMVDTKKYSRAKYVIIAIIIIGILYFGIVSPEERSIVDKIGFRLVNSSGILYFLNDATNVEEISRLYPYNAFDLFSRPLRKLFDPTLPFSSPGPYLFGGEGQGPLPSFIFDGFFYFGRYGLIYILVFPIVFWCMVGQSLRMRKTSSDGERLFYFCMLFLPAIHLKEDLAVFNGIYYILGLIFVLSMIIKKVRWIPLFGQPKGPNKVFSGPEFRSDSDSMPASLLKIPQ